MEVDDDDDEREGGGVMLGEMFGEGEAERQWKGP